MYVKSNYETPALNKKNRSEKNECRFRKKI